MRNHGVQHPGVARETSRPQRGLVEPRYRLEGSSTADTVCSSIRTLEQRLQPSRQERRQQHLGQRRQRRRKTHQHGQLRRQRARDSSTDVQSQHSTPGSIGSDRAAGGPQEPFDGDEQYGRDQRPLSAEISRTNRNDTSHSLRRSERVSPVRVNELFREDNCGPLTPGARGSENGFGGHTSSPPTRVLRWARNVDGRGGELQDESASTVDRGQVARAKTHSDEAPAKSTNPSSGGSTTDAMRTEDEVTFMEVQRDLLSRLEALFVTMSEKRREGLLSLKREKASWRAAAMEQARADRKAEHTALEDRVRERVAEEGPGDEAMEAVGLVRVGSEDVVDSSMASSISSVPAHDTSIRGAGWSGGWRLPTDVVEGMRKDIHREMDRDSAQVLDEESETLLDLRARLAAREAQETRSELLRLSERLTFEGRDALASLRRELELEAERKLGDERERHKERLASALERERERLLQERNDAIADVGSNARREASVRIDALREHAKLSTIAHREAALKALGGVAAKAREDLDALLKAQEAKALEELKQKYDAERKASITRLKDEGQRRCVQEVQDLADSRRAVEAAHDCSRTCHRLIDLVTNEAMMRLEDLSDPLLSDIAEDGNSISCVAAGTNISGDYGVHQDCSDCARLARANAELIDLLQEKARASRPSGGKKKRTGKAIKKSARVI